MQDIWSSCFIICDCVLYFVPFFFALYTGCYYRFDNPGVLNRIMDREKRLSILYQKQGRATQFASKAARDKWLQKEIDEYERVLSSNLMQVIFLVKILSCFLILQAFDLWMVKDSVLHAVYKVSTLFGGCPSTYALYIFFLMQCICK